MASDLLTVAVTGGHRRAVVRLFNVEYLFTFYLFLIHFLI